MAIYWFCRTCGTKFKVAQKFHLICNDCKRSKIAKPYEMTLQRAIGIVEANIAGHGLDIWLLRDAEEVVLKELKTYLAKDGK